VCRRQPTGPTRQTPKNCRSNRTPAPRQAPHPLPAFDGPPARQDLRGAARPMRATPPSLFIILRHGEPCGLWPRPWSQPSRACTAPSHLAGFATTADPPTTNYRYLIARARIVPTRPGSNGRPAPPSQPLAARRRVTSRTVQRATSCPITVTLLPSQPSPPSRRWERCPSFLAPSSPAASALEPDPQTLRARHRRPPARLLHDRPVSAAAGDRRQPRPPRPRTVQMPVSTNFPEAQPLPTKCGAKECTTSRRESWPIPGKRPGRSVERARDGRSCL